MKVKWLPIIAFLILLSCSKSDEKKELSFDRINLMNSNDVSIIEKISFDKLLILETSEESLFGRVDKMLIKGEKVFVLDQWVTKAIYMFDMDGQFLRKWTVGKGPDQFSSVDDFYVDNNADILTVLSGYRKKLLSYDTRTGALIGQKEAPEGAKNFTIDRERFIYEIDPKYGYHLLIENPEGDLKEQVKLPIYKSNVSPVMFGFQHHDNTITRLFPRDTIIYEITEGIAKPKFTLDFGESQPVLNDGSLPISDNQVNGLRHWLTEENVVITFDLDEKSYYVIHNLLSGETCSNTAEGGVMTEEGLMSIFWHWISASVDNQLVVSVDAHFIGQIKTIFEFGGVDKFSEKTKANLNKLYEISSKVKDSDNPVLLFLSIDGGRELVGK